MVADPVNDPVDEVVRRASTPGARSARSLAVTILGDSVAPAGGSVWLSELIELVGLFGHNERAVRTAVFRLVNEGWLEALRVGRRSRYRLTEYAGREFAAADPRIYGQPAPEWDGGWTFVFLTPATIGREQRADAQRHLRWHGFGEFAPGVMVIPGRHQADAEALLARAGIRGAAIVDGRIPELAGLAATGHFEQAFGLDGLRSSYAAFVERYAPLARMADLAILPARQAFRLRTMVIHDLRRVRLADPELPAALLPPSWPRAAAIDLAGSIYRAIDDKADGFLTERTELRASAAIRHARFAGVRGAVSGDQRSAAPSPRSAGRSPGARRAPRR